MVSGCSLLHASHLFTALAADATPNVISQFPLLVHRQSVPAGEPLDVWIPLAPFRAFRGSPLSEQGTCLCSRRAKPITQFLLYSGNVRTPRQDSYQFPLEPSSPPLNASPSRGKPGPRRRERAGFRKLFSRAFPRTNRLGSPSPACRASRHGIKSKESETPSPVASAMYDYVSRRFARQQRERAVGNVDATGLAMQYAVMRVRLHPYSIAMARSEKIPSRF